MHAVGSAKRASIVSANDARLPNDGHVAPDTGIPKPNFHICANIRPTCRSRLRGPAVIVRREGDIEPKLNQVFYELHESPLAMSFSLHALKIWTEPLMAWADPNPEPKWRNYVAFQVCVASIAIQSLVSLLLWLQWKTSFVNVRDGALGTHWWQNNHLRDAPNQLDGTSCAPSSTLIRQLYRLPEVHTTNRLNVHYNKPNRQFWETNWKLVSLSERYGSLIWDHPLQMYPSGICYVLAPPLPYRFLDYRMDLSCRSRKDPKRAKLEEQACTLTTMFVRNWIRRLPSLKVKAWSGRRLIVSKDERKWSRIDGQQKTGTVNFCLPKTKREMLCICMIMALSTSKKLSEHLGTD